MKRIRTIRHKPFSIDSHDKKGCTFWMQPSFCRYYHYMHHFHETHICGNRNIMFYVISRINAISKRGRRGEKWVPGKRVKMVGMNMD